MTESQLKIREMRRFSQAVFTLGPRGPSCGVVPTPRSRSGTGSRFINPSAAPGASQRSSRPSQLPASLPSAAGAGGLTGRGPSWDQVRASAV